MKSINSKDIGKNDEQIVTDHLKKVIRDSLRHYIGQPQEVGQEILDQLIRKIWENNGISLISQKYQGVSMGSRVENAPCLICGSNCEEDDCQLGVD